MEEGFGQLGDGQILAVLGAGLDALGDDRLRLPDDAELLGVLRVGLQVESRLRVWLQQLAARVDRSQAAWQVHRTSTTTWLVEAARLTPRDAARLVKAGQGLVRFPVVGAAATAGVVLAEQAEAITQVLKDLPGEFSDQAIAQGQEVMVALAGSHHAVELRRLTGHLLEVLAPETAEAWEGARLERHLRIAQANRHLEFHSDGQGSVLIRGSLPVVSAEPFLRIVDAYAAAEKRALDQLDPNAEHTTPGMRRADGLLAMIHHHGQQALAPAHGGDRPRVVVTLSYDKLLQQCLDAHLVGSGEPVPASAVRQLLCDADLLPMVLGGPSQILDQGRCQRLVTPEIRAALEQRDGGCVFPGCDKKPQACHAHHILPWWAGGVTALSNLVLVCAHHHGIVEPSRGPTPEDRWKVRIRTDGIPEILPPLRVDTNQRPRLHARFQTPQRR